MPLDENSGTFLLAQQGVRVIFDFEWSIPLRDFKAEHIDVSVGTISRISKLDDRRYRVEINLPYGRFDTRVTVPAGNVASAATGAPNSISAEAVTGISGAADLVLTGGEGVGGFGGDSGSGGSSAGEAGNPGATPTLFVVSFERVSVTAMKLKWNRHADGVSYYQVIRNTASLPSPAPAGSDFGNPVPAILAPFGKPIPAVNQTYNVTLPVPVSTANPVFYRIRACNPQTLDSAALLRGYTGCQDSEEFVAGFVAGTDRTGVKTGYCPDNRGLNGVPNDPYPTPRPSGCNG